MDVEGIEKQLQMHRKEVRFHRSEIQRYEALLLSLTKSGESREEKKKREIEARMELIDKDLNLVFNIVQKKESTVNEIYPVLNRDTTRDIKARNYDGDSFRFYLLPHIQKDSRFKITRHPTKRKQYIIHDKRGS